MVPRLSALVLCLPVFWASAAAADLRVTAGEETFEALAAKSPIPLRVAVASGEASAKLVALGSGIRTKLAFKVYEGVLYVDETAELPPIPFPAIIQGTFAKRSVMIFLRDVDSAKIKDAWEDGFKTAFREKPPTVDLEKARDAFLAYFEGQNVALGQTIEFTWLPGVGLCTSIAGTSFPPIDHPGLASALWSIWLGEKPISESLKQDLVRLWRASKP